MQRTYLTLALLIVAPVTTRAQPACSPDRPPDSVTFALDKVDSLVGSWEIVLVQSVPSEHTRLSRGRLDLWRQDTTRVWRTSFGRTVPDSLRRTQPIRGRYLAGAFQSDPPDTSRFGRGRASRDPNSPGVEWDLGALRIGDVDVVDGVGDDLRVHWIAPGAFGGRWRTDLGIAVLVGKDGPLPNPAGHFCARRVGS